MTFSIPSPPISGWQLGPFFLHIYALCLLTGIALAWWLGSRRWQSRGGSATTFEDILIWAIPIGIVGARFYHVMTHLGDYFAEGATQHWWAIWEGGIAIYGAIGFGAAGAWLLCRRRGVRFSSLADSLAPGIAIGQAFGRFGNWFNQELYGWPTDLPWGLEIDAAHRVEGYEQYATFHPTFAYEAIWNLGVAGVLLWADRRFALGRGKLFSLYVALYGFGRFFTEGIRLDFSYDTFGPIRFNQAVAALICLAGLAVFAWLSRNRPGREDTVFFDGARTSDPSNDEAADASPQETVEASRDEPAEASQGEISTSAPDDGSPPRA